MQRYGHADAGNGTGRTKELATIHHDCLLLPWLACKIK
jgi:hypothetical protein